MSESRRQETSSRDKIRIPKPGERIPERKWEELKKLYKGAGCVYQKIHKNGDLDVFDHKFDIHYGFNLEGRLSIIIEIGIISTTSHFYYDSEGRLSVVYKYNQGPSGLRIMQADLYIYKADDSFVREPLFTLLERTV
jgi:hypothetical protein